MIHPRKLTRLWTTPRRCWTIRHLTTEQRWSCGPRSPKQKLRWGSTELPWAVSARPSGPTAMGRLAPISLATEADPGTGLVGGLIAAIAALVALISGSTASRKEANREAAEELSNVLQLVSQTLLRPKAKQEPHEQVDSKAPNPRVPPLGLTKQKPRVHTGNIHVQGDDVKKGMEPNFAWNQPMPMTKGAGLSGLAQVRAQCTARQLKFRKGTLPRLRIISGPGFMTHRRRSSRPARTASCAAMTKRGATR